MERKVSSETCIWDITKTGNNAGMSRLGWLILILIIVSGVFVGWQVFPFYYSFWEIQGLMDSQAAKATVFSDNEIRHEVLKRAKKLNIPIGDSDDLKINRFNGKIVIDLKYSEILYVDFGEGYDYDLWEFKFNPHAEHPL